MSVSQGSPRGGSQHELGGLVWEDVEGQENFPVTEITSKGQEGEGGGGGGGGGGGKLKPQFH